MARIGMNPSKTKASDYRPARVTVAILVHIPYLSGYYEHRLSVLKASLWSLMANTKVPYDLMVFDNGSGPEAAGFLDELQRQNGLTFLLRAERNVGKIGALQLLFHAAPGEMIAYADDDFFYHPGWLGSQLALMDTFPQVGMVSGYAVPSFFAPDRTAANARFAATADGVLAETVEAFPEAWIREWAESTSRDPAEALDEESRFTPVRYTFRGLTAWGAANHDQFLCRKSVIVESLPGDWSGQLMGQMIELDRAVDGAGFLRLATAERTTQHIGNVISPALAALLPDGLDTASAASLSNRRRSRWADLRRRLLLSRPVRWLLLGVYSHLFRWINPN
jgi:glycosyltransferase involved in cell wall biosynthesis